MITLVDDLAQRGRQVIEERQRREREAAEQEQAAFKARVAEVEQAFLEATGIDSETLAGLAPEYEEKYGSALIRLRLDGYPIEVRIERMRESQRACFKWPEKLAAETDRDSLALFVAKAAEHYNEMKSAVIAELNTQDVGHIGYYFNAKRVPQPDGIWSDPDVAQARVHLLLRERPVEGTHNSYYFDEWLECARAIADGGWQMADGAVGDRPELMGTTLRGHLAQVIVEAEKTHERMREREQLLEMINGRMRAGEDGQVTEQELQAYLADVAKAGLSDDAQLNNALARLCDRKEIEEEEAARQAARQASQDDVFYPFLVYEIGYGIPVVNDDGEVLVEVESFYSVAEAPEEDGFYTTTKGERVCPAHKAWTKAHDVLTVADAPAGVLRSVEMKWGMVRMPPAGAIAIR